MKLPDMKWYSVDDLARRWDKWDIVPEDIEQMLETGILKPTRKLDIPLPSGSPEEEKEYGRAQRFLPMRAPFVNGKRIHSPCITGRVVIELAEVLRYENETRLGLPVATKNKSDIEPTPETDKELCARLKLECLDDRSIAEGLKRVFPSITPSRIGRLITEKPGITVTTDAYRKRGKRLLK